MKKTGVLIVFFITLYTNAQLFFENRQPNATIPKFKILDGRTYLYSTTGEQSKLAYLWQQVPVNYDNADGISRYKMTVTEEDNVAVRTFDITYTLYRQTQTYFGGVIQTIVYKDKKRKTKMIENYFNVKQ